MNGGENVGVYLSSAKQLKIKPTGAAEIINGNDVMVEIKCVGVSSADKNFYLDGHDGDQHANEPFILGQEASGVVLEVGKDVTDLSRGDRICLRSSSSCLKCQYCTSEKEYLCQEFKRFGSGSHHDNGFLQTTAVVPQDICYLIPDSIKMECGSIIGTIARALFICKQTGITRTSNICINGFGSFGCILIMVAKSYGIINVMVSDISEYRVDLAKTKGASDGFVIDTSESVQMNSDKLRKSCKFQPDISFECSGTEFGTDMVKLVTKSEGTVAIVGNKNFNPSPLPKKSTLKILDFKKMTYNKLDLLESISIVDSNQVECKDLITHRFELNNAEKAFKTVTSDADRSIMKSIFKVCHGEY